MQRTYGQETRRTEHMQAIHCITMTPHTRFTTNWIRWGMLPWASSSTGKEIIKTCGTQE
jgi:hypothetical protein